MDNKLDNIRMAIDSIDDELASLFLKRMELVSDVAEYKRENNLPVLNSTREYDIIARVTKNMDGDIAEYTKTFFYTMFDLSRSYQNKQLTGESKPLE